MSWDINQVTLIGRLTADPVLRYSSQGNAYCQLRLAVGRKSFSKEVKEDEVYFFNVNIFGRMAEVSGEYLTKGKQVAVSGHLRQSRWEKDDQKFSSVEIIAERVQFLTPNIKQDKDNFDNKKSFGNEPKENYSNKDLKNQNSSEVKAEDHNEDDIPF